MADVTFAVKHAGPLVTYQDGGRKGLMRYGIPRSGPMDRLAFASAHTALGNPEDGLAIEISLGGLTLECVFGTTTFALAGGRFTATLDGRPLDGWQVASVEAGQTLAIRPGSWGSWCYLAFAGNLLASSWLRSAATHEMSGLGGGALASGDTITVADGKLQSRLHGGISRPFRDSDNATYHVVMGPQDTLFSQAAHTLLLAEPFSLSNAYNRMGVQLNGPELKPIADLSIPSQPIVRGSIQVAGNGVPTVLLSDHQTTGGYPKIATLVSAELDDFVQHRSGDIIRFSAVTPEDAIEIARTKNRFRTEHLRAVQDGQTSLDDRLMTANLISGVVAE